MSLNIKPLAQPWLSADRGQKAAAPAEAYVIAPSKARRILQGESPCREVNQQWFSVRVSHPPVSSLGPMAELLELEQRTRWVKRRQRIL